MKKIIPAIVAIAAPLIIAPVAQAAPANAIIFGDSILANPNVVAIEASKIQQPLPKGFTMNKARCATDSRFANAYRKARRLPTLDYSCAGASFFSNGKHFNNIVTQSIKKRHLTTATQEVVILAGINDTYPYKTLPLPWVEKSISNHLNKMVSRIRQHAPNAKIKIMGYPTMAPDGQPCLVRFSKDVYTKNWIPFMKEYEQLLQKIHYTVGKTQSVNFVSLKKYTKNHGMCGSDPWFTGIINMGSGSYNLPVHMTDRGLTAIGTYVGSRK